MEIKKSAIAGTLESSDVQVSIEPSENGVSLKLESSVINQYGKQIQKLVLDTLSCMGVENVSLKVVDKGALDCTIKARVETAVFRACEHTGEINWGGVIK